MGVSLTAVIDDLPMVTIIDVGASLVADYELDYQALVNVGKAAIIGFSKTLARRSSNV